MRRMFVTTLAMVAGLVVIVGLSREAVAQGKRVALVIGNSAYQNTSKLTNPKNDATDIAAALKKHGFQVIDGFDLDKAAFDRKVRDFSATLKGAEAGLFFYAGHGLQVSGQNYLVPVDAKAETEDALDWEMLRVDIVHRAMERSTNTNILFLDACRDNPLARNLARSMGTRSAVVGRGLATIESGVGTLISFSTQPGNVALDGSGRNSPFAAALVKQLTSSTDDLSAMLISVRNDVMKETQRQQVPWEHSALTGRFYFNPTAQTAEPAKVAPVRLSEAAEAWGAARDSTNVAVLEAFISRFNDTFYADMAKARVEELKKQEASVAEAARKKAAEEARAKADVERQRLAMLQQEDERKRAEVEAAKKKTERQPPEKGGTLAMELSTGTVKIRLRPDLAPKHVERVRLLAKEGFYNGLTFHRVIDKFMAQGGDPLGTGTGGSRHPNLTLEPSEVQFTRGTVAAARSVDPNSANSQFFICFNDSSCKQLSKQYTVWGEVIEGMENVDKLARGEPPTKPDKIISLRITN